MWVVAVGDVCWTEGIEGTVGYAFARAAEGAGFSYVGGAVAAEAGCGGPDWGGGGGEGVKCPVPVSVGRC